MQPSPRPSTIRDDAGRIHSLLLPGNYTAEHEMGIETIHEVIGARPLERNGMPSYTGARFPDPVQHFARFASLASRQIQFDRPPAPGKKRGSRGKGEAISLHLSRYDLDFSGREVTFRYDEAEMSAKWSGEGFDIVAFTDDVADFLRDFHAALHDADAAVFFGGGGSNPFARGGLVLSIVSRVPQDLKDHMFEAHADRKALEASAAATGIRARLDAMVGDYPWQSRYRFHALAPAWSSSIRDRGEDRGGAVVTEHPVIFFLNPGDRDAESGWYTVEELDQWIAGTGPVLRNSSAEPAPARKTPGR